MNKRNVIIIISIFILIIFCIIFINKKFSKKENDNLNNIENKTNISSIYDEETDTYIITDKATGEIILTTKSKTEYNEKLEIYNEDSTYRATPPEIRQDEIIEN